MPLTNKQSAGVRHVVISAEEAGQRVDNYLLRTFKGIPKSRVYRLLRKGEVRVNGGRVAPTYRLREADRLRLPPVRLDSVAEPAGDVPGWLAQQLREAVLYEDDVLLVLDKPSGVAVHGGSGVRMGVIEALRGMRPREQTLELVHRLDRETSGCLMIAKRRSALRELHRALRDGEVEKRYLALLDGKLPRGPFPVEEALDRRHMRGGERHVQVGAAGKAARTVFRPLERYGSTTLVEADIATGRTHQIRVHAAHVGHPVLGDDKYGDRARNKLLRELGLKRLFLHAHELRLQRPNGNDELVISAPLSPDLRAVLDKLEGAAAR